MKLKFFKPIVRLGLPFVEGMACSVVGETIGEMIKYGQLMRHAKKLKTAGVFVPYGLYDEIPCIQPVEENGGGVENENKN